MEGINVCSRILQSKHAAEEPYFEISTMYGWNIETKSRRRSDLVIELFREVLVIVRYKLIQL